MREGVWTHGTDTALQAWIAGESRTVVVTREAIEDFLKLGPKEAGDMTAEHRSSFVREHLAMVIASANRKAERSDHAEDLVVIRTGELIR
jgi:hypothetical protein